MKLKIGNNKWIKRVGVITVLTAIAVVGYLHNSPATVEAEESTIQEYTLTKQSITESLSTSGVVKSKAVEQLLGDVTSEVTVINVEIGDRVSAGDILAEMNPIDVNSSILNQEVVIENLKKDIKTLSADKGSSVKLAYENAKVAYENEKSTYESNQLLFDNGAISQSDLDQSLESYNNALSQYDSQRIQYNSYDYTTEYSILEKKMQVERTKLESYEQDLLSHKIVASIDGVVTALNIEEGEIPKESDIMMELQDLSQLKIEASISEYEINDIKEGQSVSITTLGNDDVIYEGLVETIYPSGDIEGSEVYVTVVIDVLNEDEMLKPNFSANLEILVQNKESAFLVPYDALVKTPKGYAVQVKSEDTEQASFMRVETGVESDLLIEIIGNDLTEGMIILMESDVQVAAQNMRGSIIPGVGGMKRGDGGMQGGQAGSQNN